MGKPGKGQYGRTLQFMLANERRIQVTLVDRRALSLYLQIERNSAYAYKHEGFKRKKTGSGFSESRKTMRPASSGGGGAGFSFPSRTALGSGSLILTQIGKSQYVLFRERKILSLLSLSAPVGSRS
ncbi:hypothetical protein AKJ66_00155 [candidate division MSBL1 archaeon SCGC-AAA259E22]|uniref:Uncharacterized protein n=1 Tax=candidate division MSBL1 archaeon SCGC-AAA259E22 TaxID=1698265 RepID=A0A133UIF8_9EURY|nr:hypothetical protein AKJ66_00155 [candidate division MSBL1 archaeon SCGC-AAA259E22]